jgi:8-oxo-dGTP pyrophosphatase MutT (NUDIX family)
VKRQSRRPVGTLISVWLGLTLAVVRELKEETGYTNATVVTSSSVVRLSCLAPNQLISV